MGPENIHMNNISTQLEKVLMDGGASLVGFADLRELPFDVPGSLPYGVSIAVALDPDIIRRIEQGPDRDYYNEYDRVNAELNRLADIADDFLEERGFRALIIRSTVHDIEGELERTLRTPFPHKTAATRAGMGWIGKNALLVTERYGSAVRFATVLTDAPLETAAPCDESRCGSCTRCVEICPGRAPSGKNWDVTMDRADFFDAFACFRTAREFREKNGWESDICGMCISACPRTRRYLDRSE